MDAEILFFMTEQDELDFLAFAEKHCDSINIKNGLSELNVGDCKLLLTSSAIESGAMYCGKLEIRLGRSEFDCEDQEKAKSVFRKLRGYLKKNFWSRLAYENKNKKGRLTPSRNHWLGPNAKKWKEADLTGHLLKLSKTSWMEFEIGF